MVSVWRAIPTAINNVRADLLEGTQTADEGQQLLCIPHHQPPKREKNSWQQEGGETECVTPDLSRRLCVKGNKF
jgi:hypothetical protein